MIFDREIRDKVTDPEYLRRCFDQIGFPFYSDTMIGSITRLAEAGVPLTMQFDLAPDGSFLPVFSLVSNYEHVRMDFRSLFGDDCALSRTCRIYEELGVADERWQVLEDCLFAVRRKLLTADGIIIRINRCMPCCTKIKWINGSCDSSKYYLRMISQRG